MRLQDFAIGMRVADLNAASAEMFDATKPIEDRMTRVEQQTRSLWVAGMLSNEVDRDLLANHNTTKKEIETLKGRIAELEGVVAALKLQRPSTS